MNVRAARVRTTPLVKISLEGTTVSVLRAGTVPSVTQVIAPEEEMGVVGGDGVGWGVYDTCIASSKSRHIYE